MKHPKTALFTKDQLDRVFDDLKPLTTCEMEAAFNENVDALHNDVAIFNYSYLPSLVLYETDPIAYKSEFLAWVDRNLDDGTLFESSDEKFYWYSEVEEALEAQDSLDSSLDQLSRMMDMEAANVQM